MDYYKIFSVSELNQQTKQLLEQNIPLLWVRGEISNLKCYQSGHWYFTLKDLHAQVRCVMFGHRNQHVDWQPADGTQVEILALVTLYEPRGDYQLNIEVMRRAGLGELFKAFEKLKSKLDKAGLFNPARKRRLPAFARQIGIITSPDTAALRDVLTTLQRRMPAAPVIIYPTLVQGKAAAYHIVQAINMACQRAECDVLILCRGGGSIEDLWAFNEEAVAIAIATCPIPVVSGIGHETDFTIADFVADLRAPTPTAAAEMVSKDRIELIRQLQSWHQHTTRAALHRIERIMQQIDILSHRLIHPGDRIIQQSAHLRQLHDRFMRAWKHQTEKRKWKQLELNQRYLTVSPDLIRLEQHHQITASRLQNALNRYLEIHFTNIQHWHTQLQHLNPQTVLERGYSITYTTAGSIIRSSKQLKSGDEIQVKFAAGSCEADVTQIQNS